MGLLLRLLILCGAVYLIYSGVRSLFLPARSPSPIRHKGKKEQEATGTPMVQDPQCGRFIPEHEAIQVSVHGKTLSFCSSECRDQYQHSESVSHS